MEAHLGRSRELNAWGGYSKATTRALDSLHYRGRLRIAGRDNGIRLFEPAHPKLRNEHQDELEPGERLRRMVLRIAALLAPVPVSSLRAALRHLGYAAPHLEGRQSAVSILLKAGDLNSAAVEKLDYVWPAGRILRNEPEERVRFLAPFDPLVWDRRGFEHFWGWLTGSKHTRPCADASLVTTPCLCYGEKPSLGG